MLMLMWPSCRDCAIAVTQCLSDGMHDIIRAASQGAHIPPSVMHSAQDAIAAIYCLLHTHGSFMAEAGADGHDAICAAAEAMITSLKVQTQFAPIISQFMQGLILEDMHC